MLNTPIDFEEPPTRRAQLQDKCVVIVSPYFPPSTLAGVHRARHLAKHLSAAGWRPIILCVNEAFHTERLDPDLASLVPKDVEVIKVPALAASITRRFGIGDIGLRAWIYLERALRTILADRSVKIVMITGSPFYPMLLAPKIKRCFDIPVVLDFQDPWVSAWGASQNILSKASLVHRLALLLEPRAVRSADFITSVSDIQNEAMRARYPWLTADRMAAIPIGGDLEDFVALRGPHLQFGSAPLAASGFINLSYVGTTLPRSGPLLITLFRAFNRLLLREPSLAAKIRFNFIGTSNQPNGSATFRVRPLAEQVGVGNFVNEEPNRIPYLNALAWLARSNGLLLIGSDEPHYTASKIYPALMSGRPFLSLFHRASGAHRILSEAGGGCAFAFDGPEELARLEDVLADGLQRLASAPEKFCRADPEAYRLFDALSIAKQFGYVFDRLIRSRSASDDTD